MPERLYINPVPTPRERLADLLLKHGTQQETIETPIEGIGKLAQVLSGTWQQNKAYNERKQEQQKGIDMIAGLFPDANPAALEALKTPGPAQDVALSLLQGRATSKADIEGYEAKKVIDKKHQDPYMTVGGRVLDRTTMNVLYEPPEDLPDLLKYPELADAEARKAARIEEAKNRAKLSYDRRLAEMKGPETPDQKEILARAEGLRKEYTNQSKDFIKIRDALGRIQAAAKNPSAAGDMALIFNYMKVLDPGSTVREGEYATAENAAGVPARLRNTFNRVLSGQRLAPEQRQDFVSRADALYQSQEDLQKQLMKTYSGLAERAGVASEDVALDNLYSGERSTPPPSMEDQLNAVQQELKRRGIMHR